MTQKYHKDDEDDDHDHDHDHDDIDDGLVKAMHNYIFKYVLKKY